MRRTKVGAVLGALSLGATVLYAAENKEQRYHLSECGKDKPVVEIGCTDALR